MSWGYFSQLFYRVPINSVGVHIRNLQESGFWLLQVGLGAVLRSFVPWSLKCAPSIMGIYSAYKMYRQFRQYINTAYIFIYTYVDVYPFVCIMCVHIYIYMYFCFSDWGAMRRTHGLHGRSSVFTASSDSRARARTIPRRSDSTLISRGSEYADVIYKCPEVCTESRLRFGAKVYIYSQRTFPEVSVSASR